MAEIPKKNEKLPRSEERLAPEASPGGVSDGGRPGGSGDTPWDVEPAGRRGRFWKMLAASALFHVLLTPGPALLGLVAMLPAIDLADGEELVEVDLTALPVGAVAPKPEEEKRPVEPVEPEPAAPPSDEPPEEEAPDEPAPAEAEPEPSTPAEPSAEAVPTETKEFGDPVALAGSAGEIADSNANVRMFLFNDVVRQHPLGSKVGELLKRTPQWRDFFGPSKIDPVEDIDRVLIAGPQLRDSSQVVAVVQHNMGRARIEVAFQALVARKGKWIDQGALVAEARADRADRVFAAPNEKVVVVAPLALEKQVRSLGDGVRFPPSARDVAVTAYIITPANVAKGTGIQLPKTVKWARLDLRPLADGGAVLKILAEDESEEAAQQNALLFQELIRAATTMDPSRLKGGLGAMASLFGVKKQKYLKSVSFENRGAEIHGTIEVTKNQLLFAADLLAGYLPPAPAESNESAEEGAKKGETTPEELPPPKEPPPGQEPPREALPVPAPALDPGPQGAPDPDQ